MKTRVRTPGHRFGINKAGDFWLLWDLVDGNVWGHASWGDCIRHVDGILYDADILARYDRARFFAAIVDPMPWDLRPSNPTPWPWREAVSGSIPWFLGPVFA